MKKQEGIKMNIGIKMFIIIITVNLLCISCSKLEAQQGKSFEVQNNALIEDFIVLAKKNIEYNTILTATIVKTYLEDPLTEIRFFSMLMTHIDEIIPPAQRRDMINFMLNTLVLENPNYVGVWTVFEPNALDGNDAAYVNTVGSDHTGRFISYWTNDHGRISLNPL